LIETDASATEERATLAEVEALIEAQEKCIKPFVLSVERNVKFLLSQQKASLYFVESVLLKKDQEGFSKF
jgi:hypothetical protein